MADTTNMTDTGYHAVQGGVSTQRSTIREVYMGGVATASAPSQMLLGRDVVVGGTLSVGLAVVLDGSAVLIANPPVCFNTATTKPQRSSSLVLLALAFNAFGGIVRWVAAPGEEATMYGAAASVGEASLTAYTGGTPGLMQSHILLETE